MRNAWCLVLGACCLVLGALSADACTGFYVGRKVSADGTTMIGRTVDAAPWNGPMREVRFERIEIVDGKALLDVSVWSSDAITNQDWSVATNGVIEVPAPGKQGFFILKSKGK